MAESLITGTPAAASELSASTPDLHVVDGHVITTSQQVAQHFGKGHNLVLRAIRNLECSDEFRLSNFAQSSYLNEQGKEQPCYRLTRDGFVFLAMGFTGKDAAQWKEAYITAFNRMEAELLARTTRPADPAIDYTRISPAQAQELKELVHAVVESGAQGFGETWRRLHNKFKVNSYLELPASHFSHARAYLLAKMPDAMPKIITPPASPTKVRRFVTLVEPTGLPKTSELHESQHIFSTEELCSHIENEVLARGDIQKIARAVCNLTMKQVSVEGAHQFHRLKA